MYRRDATLDLESLIPLWKIAGGLVGGGEPIDFASAVSLLTSLTIQVNPQSRHGCPWLSRFLSHQCQLSCNPWPWSRQSKHRKVSIIPSQFRCLLIALPIASEPVKLKDLAQQAQDVQNTSAILRSQLHQPLTSRLSEMLSVAVTSLTSVSTKKGSMSAVLES